MNQYQVTAVCLSRDDQQVMSGGIDNDIKVFDVRKLDIAYTMTGHNDTVTGAWAWTQRFYFVLVYLGKITYFWQHYCLRVVPVQFPSCRACRR